MINSVVLVGRLTKDVELRKTQSGWSVASFTVACDRRLSQAQKNNNEQSADFINCVAWRGSADFLGNYAHKGDTVGVEGRIQTRSYEDKSGKKVYLTEVMVERLDLLEKKKESYSAQPVNYGTVYTADIANELTLNEDDLPF